MDPKHPDLSSDSHPNCRQQFLGAASGGLRSFKGLPLLGMAREFWQGFWGEYPGKTGRIQASLGV